MQSTTVTSHKQCDDTQWVSLIPSLISTSLGGAVVGGSIAQMTGALAGGAFGIIIGLCSAYRISRTSN